MPRQLPGPWRAERCSLGYVVRDANGQTLAFIPSRMTEAEAVEAGALTDVEASIITSAFVNLRELFDRRR
jgi:hypothetical protein